MSNTYHLITNKGYNSVLIELDPQRYQQLCSSMGQHKAICLNKIVGFDGDNKLDKILSTTPIPNDFDLLSIDVDGDDFHIWQACVEYTPKVVIVEINVRDKPNIDRINVHGSDFVSGISGTSIKSMTNLAKSKGYSLIMHVGCNAIYVRNEYLSLFYESEVLPEDVFTYEGHQIGELTLGELSRQGWVRAAKSLLIGCIPQSFRPLAIKIKSFIF